jgi:hypothetical protein
MFRKKIMTWLMLTWLVFVKFHILNIVHNQQSINEQLMSSKSYNKGLLSLLYGLESAVSP